MNQRGQPAERSYSLQSKAGELANALRRQIRYYLPGSRLPSHRELIEQFGVSLRVVRRALEMLETDGLIEARSRSGVRVLAQARLQPTARHLVVILPRRRAKEAWCQSILLGVDRQARHHRVDMEVIVCEANPCDVDWLERLDRKVPPSSGWAFVDTAPTEDVLATWRQEGRSVVLIDQPVASHQAHMVSSDGRGAAFTATERLLLLGHRHVAYVGIANSDISQLVSRFHGFQLAHQRHRVAIQESLILDTRREDLNLESLRRLIESSAPRPTAILTANQDIGCRTLAACEKLGVPVPGRLSVASCGMRRRELPAEWLDRLTRCDEGPPEELGHLAVEVLCGVHSSIGANLLLAPIQWQDHGSVEPPPPEPR
ncbi:MAG: HTH-type transcriptional repressor PurR [Phycisphaerae bacterium]|nr:HTH-type transcriptional repressor PurR [Phycisphaerae bacterium]